MRVAQSMASGGPGALVSGGVGEQRAQGRSASSHTQTLSPGQPPHVQACLRPLPRDRAGMGERVCELHLTRARTRHHSASAVQDFLCKMTSTACNKKDWASL